MKATYGVNGMMEWIALIPVGRNIVRVRFSGGSLSGYGVTPATFTTTNTVVMKMIENSSYFRRGKIRLISKEEAEEGKPSLAKQRLATQDTNRYDGAGAFPDNGGDSANSSVNGGVIFKKQK